MGVQRRSARLLASGSMAFLMSGCALINPYVDTNITAGLDEFSTFDKAITHAQLVQEAYADALGTRSTFRSVLGASLIPLAAATLGLGAAGASRNTVLVTGLTGTAAFGTGTWLGSNGPDAAYVAGYNAIACALSATAPLQSMKIGNTDNTAGNTDNTAGNTDNVSAALIMLRAKLDKQLGGAQENLSGLKNTLGPQSNSELSRLYREVEEAIEAGKAARRAALELEQEFSALPAQLTSSVTSIRGQVMSAIAANSLNIEALGSIIGNLGSIYAQQTTVPKDMIKPETTIMLGKLSTEDKTAAATAEKATAEKATAEKATAEKATAEKAAAEKAAAEKAAAEKAAAEKAANSSDNGTTTRTQTCTVNANFLFYGKLISYCRNNENHASSYADPLISNIGNLKSETDKLSGLISSIQKLRPTQTLRSCGVSETALAGPLSLEPSGSIAVDNGADTVRGIMIKGGVAPYFVQVSAGTPEKLTARQTAPFSPLFELKIGKDTPAGSYSVAISDGSGKNVLLPVTVTAKPAT